MTARLELLLLGGMEIRLDGAPLTAFISVKVPALLAYLAIVERPVQRDLLATLFWGEMGDADAKNNLRQALTNLRKTCDPFLEITRDSASLRADADCRLDVTEFVRGVRLAARLPAEERIAPLAEATALYRGDLLEGVVLRDAPDFEEWLVAQRARLRELMLNALHDLVGLQMAEGRFPEAIDGATRLLALDPWREEAHRQLMLALARTGQRSAALAQFEQCRRIMREVFDVEPTDETAELAAQIKAALHGPRHNLNAPINEFVGRAPELRTLRRLLADPVVRLVTLTGPGGIGKTRLALQAAAERIDYHLAGVRFVGLTPVDNGADIIPAMMEALQIPAIHADNPWPALIGYLRSRDILLVLDDFEHVLTPRNVETVARLLAGAATLRIIVTSRARLQLQAERVIEIEGLPYPAADAAAPAADYAAIELFTRRARQQDAAFALSPTTMEPVAHICRAVGGMPLAIELAAAWTRTLTIEGILDEITRGIDILTATMHDVPPRHRSMRAVFAASWQMLTAEEQAVFAGAALFRGGFETAAARAVVDATPQQLAHLVDRSLLRRTPDGRYRRHPLLLQYATEQLDRRPAEAAHYAQRHVAYFGGWLQTLTPAIYGDGQAAALEAVRRELDNVRQAWKLACEQGAFAFFAEVLDALLLVFDMTALSYVARELCESARRALAACDPATPDERVALARVTAMEGVFAFRVGDFGRARELTEGALATLRAESAAPWVLGHTHTFLGGAYFGLGDLERALAEFQHALDAYTAAGSAWGRATALGNIAEMYMVWGEEREALDYARRAQAIAEPGGNPYLLAHNTYRLAVLLANAGDYDAAQRYQRASLAHAEQLNYASGVGLATASLGDLAFATGDFAGAAQHFGAAVELHRGAGNWMDEARYLVRQAEAELAQDNLEACRALLYTALRKAIQADAGAAQMDALLQVARLWLRQQRTAEAAALLRYVAGGGASTTTARATAQTLLEGIDSRLVQKDAEPEPVSLAGVLANL